MKRFRFGLLTTLIVAIALAAFAQLRAPQRPALVARTGLTLAEAKTWGYQLQGAHAMLIPPEIDLLVIDHARDASATDLISAADVETFRQRPRAPPRIVLAYLSVGEAETYRYYWWKPWASGAYFGLMRPSWLGSENKEWKGNFQVRYWQAGWQRLIVNPNRTRLEALREAWFGAHMSYIDKLLEAGFDGVYLDRVDAFGAWEKAHPNAEADMAAFVGAISAYAKARRPGFLIVPQNGEELTLRPEYRRAIDGIAKEDLMFGLDGTEHENAADEIVHASETLTAARRAKLPVFVVEYLNDPDKQLSAQRRISELGFTLTFAERDLKAPPMVIQPLPVATAVPSVASPAPAPNASATQPPQR